MCVLFHQCHTVLIIVTLKCLKVRKHQSSHFFLLSNFVFAILGHLLLHVNFKIGWLISIKKLLEF